MKKNIIRFISVFVAGIILCVLTIWLTVWASRTEPPAARRHGRVGNKLTEARSAPVRLVRRRIDGVVSRSAYLSALDRMALTSEFSLSAVVHGMRLFGSNFMLPHPTRKGVAVPAIESILNHRYSLEYYESNPPLVPTRHGVRCRTLILRDAPHQPEREAHSGQLLASLAEAGIPLDTPLTTVSGRNHVSDIVDDTVASFLLDTPQIEWMATALALYLPPKKNWRNKFGQLFSFDDLVDHLMSTPFDDPTLSCQGTHLLYALAVIRQADEEENILSGHTRQEVDAFLVRYSTLLAETQQPSGRWPGVWYEWESSSTEELYTNDGYDRLGVITTGHHLEWLLLLPEDMAPPNRVFIMASRFLERQLGQVNRDQLMNAYCPFTHAVFTLGLICEE